MSEIGMSMEPPKKGLVEGMRKAFTVGGAKEQWYRDHAELVKKYADVNNGLSDEQRAQVMAKIDQDASKAAGWNVARNVGGVALTGAVVGFSGGLIGSERFRNWVGKGHIGNWEFGAGLKKLGEGGRKNVDSVADAARKQGEKAKKWLKGLEQRFYTKIIPDDMFKGSLDTATPVPPTTATKV